MAGVVREIMSMKSPFRAGVKKVKKIAADKENKTKKKNENEFCPSALPQP
jgi:hypothetical protein